MALAACSGKRAATAAARTYEERRAAGDVVVARSMLSNRDQGAIQLGTGSLNDAGISTTGIPEGLVDSARAISEHGDSVIVAVFLTAPNFRQAMGALFARAMAGGIPDSSEARKMVKSLPRVTTVDTVALVREEREWKVSASLPERHKLAQLELQLSSSSGDEPLSVRANAARQYLAAARSLRGADPETVESASDVLRGAALADSLRFDLSIEPGYMRSIRGTVTNYSRTPIAKLWLRVTDARGGTTHVTVYGVGAGKSASVFELAGDMVPGAPSRVEVLNIELRS